MPAENIVRIQNSDGLNLHLAYRCSAILTKYENLRSYQLIEPRISPLDYEIAGYYTNDLLDAMMDYKNIWKEIHISESFPS